MLVFFCCTKFEDVKGFPLFLSLQVHLNYSLDFTMSTSLCFHDLSYKILCLLILQIYIYLFFVTSSFHFSYCSAM